MTLAEPIPAPEILQQLHRFLEMGSVLYIAAHPDDENTELITCRPRAKLPALPIFRSRAAMAVKMCLVLNSAMIWA